MPKILVFEDIFLEIEGILTGLHNPSACLRAKTWFKDLGWDRINVRGLVGMITVGVRRWLIHSDYACPHKDIETKGVCAGLA